MAIESTFNQQRKYLRCHMKPAYYSLTQFTLSCHMKPASL